MLTPEPSATALHTALQDRLDASARDWLARSLAEARADADADAGKPADEEAPAAARIPAWELRFAAAGRRCTRAEGPRTADPEAAEAARVLLLHAARADARTLTRLYGHGTAAERRAVLVALPYLAVGADARPLVEDALRTHDTRLIAAAVGPYAARHLDPHAWRHAVLKCLFTGVPVAAVAELARRAAGDAELARMLDAYAHERIAAGRPVPDDLHHVLALTPAPPPPSAT